jgi:transcription antitermination protein NusB
MAARSKARKRALDVLFEAEVRETPVLALLAERITLGGTTKDGPPVPEYAAELVRGVVTHQDRIDELIAEYAEGWTMDRMPVVDKNVLRIAVFELFWADDVPDGVVISEAVELAGDLSTDASSGFVNGLLARLADRKPAIVLYPEAPEPAPEPDPAPDPAAEPAPDPDPAPDPAAEAALDPAPDHAAAPELSEVAPAPETAATPSE